MKKRVVSIILMLVMVLSLIPSVYAEEDNDFGGIINFEQLREAIKKAESPFKTNEDKDEFRHMYWKSVLPDFSKEVYPKGHKLAGQPIRINNNSVDAYKIFYYGHGDLIKENTEDSKGNINYLGYTADGRYVVNMFYNEKTMLNPKKELIDKYFGKPNVKYYGKVRPFRTNYTDPLKVGEMYLGKEASKGDKVQYGKLIISEWMKHITVRDTGWEKGREGQTFYDVFGGNVDEFIKYVAITCPPTSRSNGQATVWFISDNGLPENKMPNGKYQTRRTFVIEKTDPVDIIAIQDGFKGTTIKPDGSISFTFDYKVKGLERVKGKTSIFYVVSAPSEYMNLNDDLISNLRKELPKGTQLDYWFARDRKIGILTMLIPVEIDWNLLNDYQTIYLDLKTSVFNSKYASQNSPLSMFVDEYDNPIAGMNTVVGLNLGHLEKNKRQDINALLGMFDDIKGLKEYKAGGYENNIIYGGLSIQSLELGILGREPNDEYTEEEKPLEYKVEENQKELDILMTVFKVFDITEDNKKTNVILYDEKGKEINKKEIELKGTTNGEEEIIEDIDMKLNLEGLSKGEHKFYAVVNSDFNLTKPYPIEYERADQLENNILEIKVVIPGEEDFEIIANKHKIEVDKKDKGEIELSYNVNLKGTEKEIPTVVDLYRGDKVIESINIKSKGGTSQEVKFKVPIVILEEGINNFYGVVNADYNLKEARPFGIIKK